MTVNSKTAYWGNSYVYDAWGNLLQKNVTKCSAENLSVTVGVNNRISSAGYTYDPAGNMTVNATDGVTATYDAESRIATALKSGVTTTYTYDSDGNRVKKTNGNNDTLYWYMTPGIVAESDLSGATKSEYVFFAGERVARRDGPAGAGGVFYYFSDHLKTASVITDAAGTIKAEFDYYPWGGELQFVANDSNHYKFTGKERDTETGLDYFGARYYSNGLGRFISADWSATPIPVPYADLGDPQSLNLQTYVRNIPTTRYDIDGHDTVGDILVGFIPITGPQAMALVKDFVHFALHEYQPHVPGLPPPQNGCVCPPQNGQDNKKDNKNNSKSDNQQEQGGQSKKGTGAGKDRYSGRYADGQKAHRTNVPRDAKGKPEPLSDAKGAHSRLQPDAKDPNKTYSATEFDANGNPVKRIDFAGRKGDPIPHQHRWDGKKFDPKHEPLDHK